MQFRHQRRGLSEGIHSETSHSLHGTKTLLRILARQSYCEFLILVVEYLELKDVHIVVKENNPWHLGSQKYSGILVTVEIPIPCHFLENENYSSAHELHQIMPAANC